MTYYHPATNPIDDVEFIIKQVLPKHQHEAKRLVEKFEKVEYKKMAKVLHSWLGENIQYEADEMEEIIKTPSSLLSVRRGDCEDVALLVSSVLCLLKKPHLWVLCDYGQGFEHVYISCSLTIIDFTQPFNKEASSVKKRFYFLIK